MCGLRNIAMHDYQESVTTPQTHKQTDGQSDLYVPLCAYILQGSNYNQSTKAMRSTNLVDWFSCKWCTITMETLTGYNNNHVFLWFELRSGSKVWPVRTVRVELSWIYWCFTSHATIFWSYMWRHRCAGGLKKKLKLYLRSGSQRHRHFAGFFNVPVLHRHGTNLFYTVIPTHRPFSRLLRHAGDTEDVFST